jgi:hypothetical protein
MFPGTRSRIGPQAIGRQLIRPGQEQGNWRSQYEESEHPFQGHIWQIQNVEQQLGYLEEYPGTNDV